MLAIDMSPHYRTKSFNARARARAALAKFGRETVSRNSDRNTGATFGVGRDTSRKIKIVGTGIVASLISVNSSGEISSRNARFFTSLAEFRGRPVLRNDTRRGSAQSQLFAPRTQNAGYGRSRPLKCNREEN